MGWLIDFIARVWRDIFGGAPPASPSRNPPATPPQSRQQTPAQPRKTASPAPKVRWPKRKAPSKTGASSGQPKTRQQASDARLVATTASGAATKAGRVHSPPLPSTVVDRAIGGLSHRSMLELRQQWLNAINRSDDPQSRRFREAVLAEWKRRARYARTPADYFVWPTSGTGHGDGSGTFENWNQQGMLKYLGYQVGATDGLKEAARRHILDAVFSNDLPPVNGPDYLSDWGPAGSPPRLRRLAEEIARFARNAKNKRSANMAVAISDWEDDLRYLRDRYYRGRFNFGWPRP